MRLEQAYQLLTGRHRLAIKDAPLALGEDALDQRPIMAELGAPALGRDPGEVGQPFAGLGQCRLGGAGAGAPGNAAACRKSRVMMRTASHNSALSLGSCISAAVTVLSIRTVAPLSSLSCLALANTARLTASQVCGRIALIVWCSTDFFGDQDSGKRAKARNEAESSR